MSERVRIVEVGPRDGLQNEKTEVDTAIKIELINRLSDCGLKMIEATSFVSPKAIPQLADAEAVFKGIKKADGAAYPVLVPNLKGLERAISVGVQEVAVFASASETFSQKNINMGIEESLQQYQEVVARAKNEGLWVRGYISCVLGCPYEGKIAPSAVEYVATAMIEMGVNELSIGDTIGVGTPAQVKKLLAELTQNISTDKLAVHFHDTYGQALANVYTALEAGIRIVDSSVAGLGGCPYAKGATGNVATEDVVYLLHGLGFETGVDFDALVHVGDFICKTLQCNNHARAGIATLAKQS